MDAKVRIILRTSKKFGNFLVNLASPNVLSLEKTIIHLAFCSLIRTFAPKIKK